MMVVVRQAWLPSYRQLVTLSAVLGIAAVSTYSGLAFASLCLPGLLQPQPVHAPGKCVCDTLKADTAETCEHLVRAASTALNEKNKFGGDASSRDKRQAAAAAASESLLGQTKTAATTADSDAGSRIVDMARKVMADNKGPLLLTIINSGYLPVTFNWLCNTATLAGVHQRMVFLVQGKDAERELHRLWPEVKTVTVNETDNELQGPLNFGTVGYIRMMVRRTELIDALVQSNVSFILFETDFIWFENPVPHFLQLAEEQQLDMVGTLSSATKLMCGAFIYFRATPRTRLLWAEVTRQMHVLETRVQQRRDRNYAPYGQNEQVYLDRLLKANYAGTRYGLVDFKKIVDGRWYTWKAYTRKKMTPLAIHNNFLSSPQRKQGRFRRFGHWLLNPDLTCNRTTAHNLLRRYADAELNNLNILKEKFQEEKEGKEGGGKKRKE